MLIVMAADVQSGDSGKEFEGFTLRDIEEAETKYVAHLLELDDAETAGSDLEISDIDSESDEESESSDDDVVLADYNRWSDNLRQINVPAFTGPQPGPTSELQEFKKEIDFLNLVFPTDMYTILSNETNRYAELALRSKANPSWYKTTPEEMRAFLGCLIVMGIVSGLVLV